MTSFFSVILNSFRYMTEKNQFKPLKGWVGHGGNKNTLFNPFHVFDTSLIESVNGRCVDLYLCNCLTFTSFKSAGSLDWISNLKPEAVVWIVCNGHTNVVFGKNSCGSLWRMVGETSGVHFIPRSKLSIFSPEPVDSLKKLVSSYFHNVFTAAFKILITNVFQWSRYLVA